MEDPFKVQGLQRVPQCQLMAKGTKRSKVGNGYPKVQGQQKVLKSPWLVKGTFMSKVGKTVLPSRSALSEHGLKVDIFGKMLLN